MNWLNDIELIGEKVKLKPLRASDDEALLEAASDGELWNLWYTSVPSINNVHNYIDFALNEKELKRALPFLIIDKNTDKIIGSTRYCNAEPANRRLEIGYTWYAKTYQRTGVNTECKFLLLQHAFEQLDCIAVEFRTNWHNLASRKAIERLGAKRDGILRNHKINSDGSFRDSAVYSITSMEWGSVKMALTHFINKYN